jgi:hypothetical protein
MRQLTTAWLMYANETKGFLVSAETGDATADTHWQEGWVKDVPGTPPPTPTLPFAPARYGVTPRRRGLSLSVFLRQVQLRSYSFSTHMNGSLELVAGFKDHPEDHPTIPSCRAQPNESAQVVFIEEYDDRAGRSQSAKRSDVQPGLFLT